MITDKWLSEAIALGQRLDQSEKAEDGKILGTNPRFEFFQECWDDDSVRVDSYRKVDY
ncbi:MAG: hypothetical protein ACYTXC_21925 [Nostoc sp.]